MTQEAADLLKKALALPDRVAAAWDEEVDRRMAEIDSGTVKPVAIEDARRRLCSVLE